MKQVPSFNDASSERQLAIVAGSLHGQGHANGVERSAAAGKSLQRSASVELGAVALRTSLRFALLSSGDGSSQHPFAQHPFAQHPFAQRSFAPSPFDPGPSLR